MTTTACLAISLTALALSLTTAAASPAQAAGADFQPLGQGTFVLDLRASDVFSDASDPIKTAAGAATGLHVHVGDSVMPTLGFTYFLTRHVAVEAILGSTRHDIYARGDGVSVKVKQTWVLPPVAALQYHFRPGQRISPYVGAGVAAMIFYGGDNQNGYRVRINDNVGAAVQAGTDIALSGPWALNLDLKKVFVDDRASINSGALTSDVGLNPWVVSVGVARRF